jgi:predicted metal-dependent hydrolase
VTDAPVTALVERRVRLAHADRVDPAWNPRHPELAYAADGVSLILPYGEPYIVRTIRRAVAELEAAGHGELAADARLLAAQEARHHAEHRRFNDRMVAVRPALARVERWMSRAYGWLERTRSAEFSRAFAASSETIAFSIARWADQHDDDVFEGVEPTTAALFRWHLAEEVEHKAVAHDVWAALGGGRLRYVAASLATFGLLVWFTVATILTLMLCSPAGRSPGCWLRLVRWALGIGFVTVPNMVVAMLPGHHPSDLVDPPGLVLWLRYFDPATGTVPLLEPGATTIADPPPPHG